MDTATVFNTEEEIEALPNFAGWYGWSVDKHGTKYRTPFVWPDAIDGVAVDFAATKQNAGADTSWVHVQLVDGTRPFAERPI